MVTLKPGGGDVYVVEGFRNVCDVSADHAEESTGLLLAIFKTFSSQRFLHFRNTLR